MIERALDKGRRVGINEVAERLYTSRSKLCATFKAQTGESLGAYIRRRRMERAQDLLADSSLTIVVFGVCECRRPGTRQFGRLGEASIAKAQAPWP